MVEIISQDPHTFQLTEFLDHIRLAENVDNAAAQRSLDAAVLLVERWTGLLTRRTTLIQRTDFFNPPFRAMYGPVIAGTTTVNQTDIAVFPNVTTDVTDKFLVLKDQFWYLYKQPSESVEYFGKTYSWQYDAGSTSYPYALKLAVFMLGAHLYENREATTECKLEQTPIAFQSIIWTYWNGDS